MRHQARSDLRRLPADDTNALVDHLRWLSEDSDRRADSLTQRAIAMMTASGVLLALEATAAFTKPDLLSTDYIRVCALVLGSFLSASLLFACFALVLPSERRLGDAALRNLVVKRAQGVTDARGPIKVVIIEERLGLVPRGLGTGKTVLASAQEALEKRTPWLNRSVMAFAGALVTVPLLATFDLVIPALSQAR